MILSLDPVPLKVLAEYLRDEEWLDVRVCDRRRPLERVVIDQIVVGREVDEVVLLQEVLQPEGAVQVNRYTVDSENIMYVNPTVFALEDVTEPDPDPISLGRELGGGLSEADRNVLRAAAGVVASMYDMAPVALMNELRGRRSGEAEPTYRRHLILAALYMFTEVSGPDCCLALGYRSPMAWVTVRGKYTGSQALDFQRNVDAVRRVLVAHGLFKLRDIV